MRIGHKLRGGETIELIGDLGAGKTAFVRGLAKGMGSTDPVSSPSFTISNRYNAGGLTLDHFDFHRLNEPGIMRRELAESLQDPSSIAAVEWADSVKSVMPEDCLRVNIIAISESGRQLRFSYPAKLKYLIPNQ